MPNGGSDCCGTCPFYSNNMFSELKFSKPKRNWIQRVFFKEKESSTTQEQLIVELFRLNKTEDLDDEFFEGHYQGILKFKEYLNETKLKFFNKENVSALSNIKLSFCSIRNLRITKDPFYTFCANHPLHNVKMNKTPVGDIFISDNGWNHRIIWKKSNDSEEIRTNLLSNLQQVVFNYNKSNFFQRDFNRIVILKLGELKEKKALLLLENLIKIAAKDKNHLQSEADSAIRSYFLISEGIDSDFLLEFINHENENIRFSILNGLIQTSNPNAPILIEKAIPDNSTLIKSCVENTLKSCFYCKNFCKSEESNTKIEGKCTLREYFIDKPLTHLCVNRSGSLPEELNIPIGPIYQILDYSNQKIILKETKRSASDLEISRYFKNVFIPYLYKNLENKDIIFMFEEFLFTLAENGEFLNCADLIKLIYNLELIITNSKKIIEIKNSAVIIGQSIEIIFKLTTSEHLEKLIDYQLYGLERKGDLLVEHEHPYVLLESFEKKVEVFAPIRYHFVRALEFIPKNTSSELLKISLNDPHYQIRIFAQQIISLLNNKT